MIAYVAPYKVSTFAISDVGLVRHNNEDVWTQLPQQLFFVLADGMGGHKAGEVASRQAVDLLCAFFKEKFFASDQKLETAKLLIAQAIEQVNQTIHKMATQYEDLRGMGTTLCCVFLHQEGLVYGHVGDSRIYRLRNQELKQLTQDHSLVQELVDLGQLDERQAEDFLYKHIITKAIGTEPLVVPSVESDSILIDDIILLCSDGLTDLVSHQDIQNIMNHTPEAEMAQRLVKVAKQRGGADNITIVLIKVLEKYATHLSGS